MNMMNASQFGVMRRRRVGNNLFTNNQATGTNTLNNTTGYGVIGTVSVSSSTDWGVYGPRSLKATTSGANNDGIQCQYNHNGVAGNYTYFYVVKIPNGLNYQLVAFNQGWQQIGSIQSFVGNNELQVVTNNFSVTAGTTEIKCGLRISGAHTAASFYVGGGHLRRVVP